METEVTKLEQRRNEQEVFLRLQLCRAFVLFTISVLLYILRALLRLSV